MAAMEWLRCCLSGHLRPLAICFILKRRYVPLVGSVLTWLVPLKSLIVPLHILYILVLVRCLVILYDHGQQFVCIGQHLAKLSPQPTSYLAASEIWLLFECVNY